MSGLGGDDHEKAGALGRPVKRARADGANITPDSIPRLAGFESRQEFITRLSHPAGAPCIFSQAGTSWPIACTPQSSCSLPALPNPQASANESFHQAVHKICERVGDVECHEATRLTYIWRQGRCKPRTISATVDARPFAELCVAMTRADMQAATTSDLRSEVGAHDVGEATQEKKMSCKSQDLASGNGKKEETHVYIQARDLPVPALEGEEESSTSCTKRAEEQEIEPSLDAISELVRTPTMLDGLRMRQFNMWLGSCCTSRIHFDGADNLHVVVGGRKRVRLWSATEVKRMYPQIQRRAEDAARGRADAYANDDDENKSSSDRSNKNKEDSSSSGSNTNKTQPASNSTASLARDLTHPASTCAEAEAIEEEEEEGEEVEHEQPLAKSAVDSSLWHSPARFPLFSRVPFSEATLGPGDALFIPRGVWHEFFTYPDPAVSFNWWFALPDALDHLQLAARHRPTMMALHSELYERLCCRASEPAAEEDEGVSAGE